MVKINNKYHITKKGVKKRNPEKFNRQDRIIYLINIMNKAKFNDNGITKPEFTANLMNQRMSDEMLKSELWNNLSLKKSSGKLFEKQTTDPTLPIIFVNIDFLRNHRGNRLNSIGKSTQNIKDVLSKGKLNSVPFYDIKDKKVGEGNHRVEALYELGYKSVPVHIYGGWD